ncbi:MAG TPA: hypothetical protein VFS43_32375 [Polyangiaceae bacterium]|nr:hypothetical protein [Polyangiaceae bacterium]
MMKTTAPLALALALCTAACGPSEPAKSAEGAPAGEHHEGGHHEGGEHGGGHHEGGERGGGHHEMGGAVKSFHDVLAPVYHADKNGDRNAKACGAVPTFKERGGAIGAEAGGDAKKKASADALVAAVGDLEKACGEGGQKRVDPTLEKVHDAFHAVMEGK